MTATAMRRIMVLGGSGSGKSTFARQIGATLHLPVIHLDQLYHGPDWTPPAAAVFAGKAAEAAAGSAWVIDGNYLSTAGPRVARADTVIFLDIPRRVAMARVIRRLLLGYGRQRPDAAEGCRERFDPEFLRYVWRWQQDKAPAVRALIARFPGTVAVLRDSSEASNFLQTLAHAKIPA